MKIAAAAQRLGVSAHTLRYYEAQGLLPFLAREVSSGHREFTSADVEWVDFVLALRSTGMPVRLVREYTRLMEQGDDTWQARKSILAAHRERVLKTRTELDAHLDLLNQKLALGCAPRRPAAVATG